MTTKPQSNKASVMPRHITVLAPAKVNLFLHIIGRRDDGYHLLESLLAFSDFGDRISVRKSPEIEFSVTGPFAHICRKAGCDGEKNIVVKAAKRLQELTGTKAGAEIILEKNIPLSAGLGGGSSDAAATLNALQILWNVEPEEEALFDLALELGADVPACLIGEPSFVTGIGEHITPLEMFDDLACVLINPLKPLSTPAVFGTFARAERPFSDSLALSPELMEDLQTLLKGSHNDLQGPALGLCDDVSDILGALQGIDGCYLVRMSGSGATCFGLFETPEKAEDAARSLANAHPEWWVKACGLSANTQFLIHA